MGSLGFTYPVFGGLVLRPIAWFDLGLVQVGYSIIATLLFAAVIWWLVRPIARRHGWPAWFTFGLAFVLGSALEPIREAFTFGQINFLLWALIAFDLLVLFPRGSRFVGIGIGLATAIKLVPGIFIGYLLVCRRWRAAGVAAGTTALATLLGFAVDAHDSWRYFTSQMLGAQGVGQFEYTFNQSVMGMLARLGHTGHPQMLVWLIFVLPVLGYGLWRAGRAATAGDEVAGMALAGLVGSLVSPLTWAHHIFWFVPALLVLIDSALPPAGASGPVIDGIRGRRGMLLFAAVIYATVTFSVLSWFEFTLGKPGGVASFVLSNWFMWIMVALLPLLPLRRLPVDSVLLRPDQVAV